ncbi:hypothetical protein NDU88_000474 [Pleurodeles waltl]|uniref:Uncharacterized protein n=1 Tax=Pleurodeles waltl TaxID=8319 RepID=A0AAV7V569_PLEWA|nr:hypothetical protein NDU88_000474 [Pleurodeles waltl]
MDETSRPLMTSTIITATSAIITSDSIMEEMNQRSVLRSPSMDTDSAIIGSIRASLEERLRDQSMLRCVLAKARDSMWEKDSPPFQEVIIMVKVHEHSKACVDIIRKDTMIEKGESTTIKVVQEKVLKVKYAISKELTQKSF